MEAAAMPVSDVRVLRLIARLNVGGPAIHVSLLTQAIQGERQGVRWRSVLAAGELEDGEGDMSYLLDQYGVTCEPIEGLHREIRLVNDCRAFINIIKLIKRYKPHVVHTHTAKAGLVGRAAAILCSVPVTVHTFHGHVFSGYFTPLKTKFFLLLERFLARFTSKVCTLSQSLQLELVEKYQIAEASKFAVVPLGLDLDRFLHSPRERADSLRALGIEEDAKLVGLVGRMVPVKRHDIFLQAAKIASQLEPKLVFLLVGSGELEEQIRQTVVDEGLKQVVKFLGWVTDLVPVYSALDTLVISSDNEGTPVSIIEALAAGCSVVSTDVGGVRDLLDDGRLGTLVPKGDVQALAQAIVDSSKTTAQPEVRAEIACHYSITRLASDLESLYLSALEDHSRKKNIRYGGVQMKKFLVSITPPIIRTTINKMRGIEVKKKDRIPKFTHAAVGSYSQYQDDLILEALLSSQENGFYVDVGANHPSLLSNTKRFYDKGWTGINVEPIKQNYELFTEQRDRDINLNIGVSNEKSELTFYYAEEENGVFSSFDKKMSSNMSAKRTFSPIPYQFFLSKKYLVNIWKLKLLTSCLLMSKVLK